MELGRVQPHPHPLPPCLLLAAQWLPAPVVWMKDPTGPLWPEQVPPAGALALCPPTAAQIRGQEAP